MAWKKLKTFLELIKFEHTLFALPFAYLGMLLAKRGWPGARIFFWVTLAMVSARTAGMTLNRLMDREIDRRNPRTQRRPLVTGEFSLQAAWSVAFVSLAIFFLSAYFLNPACFKLSPIAVILLSGYHTIKRFSWMCHFALGLVLGIAPIGGWLGVTGTFSWVLLLLSLAVLFWVAGFDILYSLQDVEFDKTHGLHSVPVRFGQETALKGSAHCHVATAVFLTLFGLFLHLGILYWVGVAVSGALLKLEHKLIEDGNLSRINTAFFVINGWIGVLLLIFTFLEVFR